MPYTNLHTKFQKNPSMFVEFRANTNVHRFHAQPPPGGHFEFPILAKLHTYGILSNMLTQYEIYN